MYEFRVLVKNLVVLLNNVLYVILYVAY